MNVVEQMLARYPAQDRDHALREVMQEIALAGLAAGEAACATQQSGRTAGVERSP